MAHLSRIAVGSRLLSILLAVPAFADDFSIDTGATETNGGYVLDGEDSITVTQDGSVTTRGDEADGLVARGYSNTVTNSGLVTTRGDDADGLFARGHSNTVTNSGLVTTRGVDADGLVARGYSNTLTNSGLVTTRGGAADGLFARGDSNTLINSGTVITIGFGAYSLHAIGDSNTLINNGTVVTIARYANGLSASDDSNTLINIGTVMTRSYSSVGLNSDGDNNRLTNSGTVTTRGVAAHGLFAAGDGNALINSGTVATSGSYADGLKAYIGNRNTLTNSGTVTTRGFAARGLHVYNNDNTTLINSGTVTTRGRDADGLVAWGANNTLINSGAITTRAPRSSGLDSQGEGTTLINSGTVTTSGGYALGFSAFGNNNTLVNSGTVTTSGKHSHGLQIYGGANKNMLTNSGTVTTRGREAHGLAAFGERTTLTNSGRILSEQSYSLFIEGSKATVNLLQGSRLQGDVHFSDPDTASLNFETGLNAVVRTDGSVPATLSARNHAYAVQGDTIYAVDLTGFEVADQSAGTVGRLVLDTLETGTFQGGTAEGSGHGLSGSPVWAQAFGGYYDQEGDAATVAYHGGTAGLLVGADIAEDRGFFFGASRSHFESESDFEMDSRYLLGGYHGKYDTGALGVDAALTLGAARNSSERTVANNQVAGGLEAATADYNNYFVMPAVTFTGDWPGANETVKLQPSLRLRYAAIWQDGYTETGSSANLDVDSRLSHLVDARLQLQSDLRSFDTETGMLFTTLRLGVEAQYLARDDVSTALSGQPLVFAAGEEEISGRAFLGLERQHLSDDGDRGWQYSIELGRTSYDRTDVSANLGWSMRF